MKTIFLHYKNRLIIVAMLITLLEVLVVYLFNFQHANPLIGVISNIYSCFSILIVTILPFMITRRAAKEFLLSKETPGWMLGIYTNMSLLGLFFFYLVFDFIVKVIFTRALLYNFNWTVYLIGSTIGVLIVLCIGLFAGWLAQMLYQKRE